MSRNALDTEEFKSKTFIHSDVFFKRPTISSDDIKHVYLAKKNLKRHAECKYERTKEARLQEALTFRVMNSISFYPRLKKKIHEIV